MRAISKDGTRAVTDEPVFAIAAYRGNVEGGNFLGTHAGVFYDPDEALGWVESGEPQPKVLYPWQAGA